MRVFLLALMTCQWIFLACSLKVEPFSYTSFNNGTVDGHGTVMWFVHGYDENSQPLRDLSGTLKPFGKPCSVATSPEYGKVFILDGQSLVNSSTVALSIYDHVPTAEPMPTMTLVAKIELDNILSGDKCFLATLGNFVYVSTNNSTLFSKINWKTLEHKASSNYVPPVAPTTSITVSDKIVVVVQSQPKGINLTYQYIDEEGKTQSIGGGKYVAATNQGVDFYST